MGSAPPYCYGGASTSRTTNMSSMRQRAGRSTYPGLLAIGPSAADWRLVSAFYLGAYVLLDWMSFIYPLAPFGITPWNPPTGLSFTLILLLGRRFYPLLFVAPLLADLVVRGWPLPTWLETSSAFVIGGTYVGALHLLTAPATGFDARLASVRDVVVLLVVAFLSAAMAAILYVATLTFVGALQAADFWPATLRFWIGDVIGIAILTPFLLLLVTGQLPKPNTLEDMLSGMSIFLVVTLVFSIPASPDLQLLYLLFLPIIWIALRSGLERVTVGLVLTQVALVAGVQLSRVKAGTVTSFQILLLFLAITGLAMGAVVSQQRRAQRQLRLQQEALAKVARIGSMGALGAAIAHEINQPLSAIATYADIVRSEIEKSHLLLPTAAEAARKTITQVERTADIVRRLRDLIRLGQSEVGPYSVRQIIDETKELLHDHLVRHGAMLQVMLAPDLPAMLADRLQIEQVLVNLIRNAVEATTVDPPETRIVTVQATRRAPNLIELSVHDTGPGFASEMFKAGVLPLSSTKPDGTGLGLMICKTIVEAHGGRLWVDSQGAGGVVRFTVSAAP